MFAAVLIALVTIVVILLVVTALTSDFSFEID